MSVDNQIIFLSLGRGALLGELRTNVSTLLALHQNVSELREKYTNLTGNVEQRLKWAAGSNPTIAQVLVISVVFKICTSIAFYLKF